MPKVLKLSIVGCGDIAGYVAFLARLTPRIKLTACCDISQERAEFFANKHKIPRVFTDFDQMLTNAPMDAVYLAVPHNLHFEMIKTAVDAGIHIFTEKPITRTLFEGQEIVAYAKERDIKIGVNYQYRYDIGCYALARAIQSGALGRILYARINLPWHRKQSYFENSPWHKTISQAGGGTLITQASHLIDVTLWAIGSYPISARGYIDRKVFTGIEVEDLALGTIELKNGIFVQIASSMVAVPEQPVTIEIYGDRGTAIYSNQPKPRVRFFGVKAKKEHPPCFGFHALHRCLKGFRDWILKDTPFLIPGEAALPALAAVEAVYQSAKENPV